MFFRDPACPFCNFRIYELTNRYAEFSAKGLEIIDLFSAPTEDVKRFVARNPRPFSVVADAEAAAYDVYQIERSLGAKLKAILTRIPTLLKGLKLVGLAGLNTNNVVPADFLIDEKGRIVEVYYGKDAGDHVSMERIAAFAAGK